MMKHYNPYTDPQELAVIDKERTLKNMTEGIVLKDVNTRYMMII